MELNNTARHNLCLNCANTLSTEFAENRWIETPRGYYSETYLNSLIDMVGLSSHPLNESLAIPPDSVDLAMVPLSLLIGYKAYYPLTKDQNCFDRYIIGPIHILIHSAAVSSIIYFGRALFKYTIIDIGKKIFLDEKPTFINKTKATVKELFYAFCLQNIPKDACSIGEEETISRLNFLYKKITTLNKVVT